MEKNYNEVTVEKTWSLMAFAQKFGMPKLAEFTNKETGEKFNSLAFDKNGDIKDSNRQSLEYLDFVHPFNASGTEQEDYTNINEPINIKEDKNRVSRDVGVCCLQPVNATTGNNLFNKWTDLKRIKVITPAGPRVVQTAEPAVWNDTDSNDKPNIWTEGWNDDYDTKMVQVKRHAKVDDFSWFIDCYMKDIDELYNIASTLEIVYANNQWIVRATNNNQSKDYIFLMMNQ